MDVSRWVSAIYVGFTAVFFVIFMKFFNWMVALIDAIEPTPILGESLTLATVLAAAATIGLMFYLYRKPIVYTYVSEVVVELSKVTWPDWDETRRNTLVVLGFTVILSVFLYLSDQVWLRLSNIILGGG